MRGVSLQLRASPPPLLIKSRMRHVSLVGGRCVFTARVLYRHVVVWRHVLGLRW